MRKPVRRLATLLASERCPPYKECKHIKKPFNKDGKFDDQVCIRCFTEWANQEVNDE